MSHFYSLIVPGRSEIFLTMSKELPTKNSGEMLIKQLTLKDTLRNKLALKEHDISSPTLMVIVND